MKGISVTLWAVLVLLVAAPVAAQDAGAATPPAEADAGAATPPEGQEGQQDADAGTATPPPPQPAEGQPAEGQPAEGQPAEGQPAEGQPAEGEPAEAEPAEQPEEPEPTQVATPPSTGQTEDTGEGDEETPEDRPAWRGSTVILSHTLGMYTLAPGQSDNPYFSTDVLLTPRWYLNQDWFVRARWGFTVEWTQNDGDADYEQEPVVTDLRVDVGNGKLLTVGDFALAGNVGLRLPLSTASLANEMILGGYVTAAPSYTFPDVLEGLSLSASLVLDVRGYASDTRQTDVPYPCEGIDGAPHACTSTGAYVAPFRAAESVTAELAITPEISVGLGFGWTQVRALQTDDDTTIHSDGSVTSAGAGLIVIPPGSETGWSHTWGASLSATWSPLKWLSVGLTYDAETTQTDGTAAEGTGLRNPFWSPDSSVALDLTFVPDQLLVPPRAEARRAARRLARAPRSAR